MELPADIQKQILDYLHLEYGEDASDPSSLKLSEISYDGLHEINGVPTHFFKYESRSGRNWATVEPHGDSYLIGMTSRSPTPLTKKELYKTVHVESSEYEFSKRYELEEWGGGCYGFSDYREIQLPGKRQFKLLVEVTAHSFPTGVTVSIIEGDIDIYVRGSVGLAISYESKTIGSLCITVGTGPWE